MDKNTIMSIENALKHGFRVELIMNKDGNIIVQTVQRKQLKNLKSCPQHK